jgi:alanyl-tRNA synthetase
LNGNEVRREFLDFFQQRDHRLVASSPLVPARDPTLLFTNAGMNQFKDIFLGREKRSYRRAASCQKCLRVSGKHNDLEQVGRTSRHHTFFEMLGNFSFGDYFKEEAIPMAWDLLTGRYGLVSDRLWVSVFEEDEEAATIWIDRVGVATGRIVRLGAKDNFWQMGETGPCGPCSEIHFDHGSDRGCGRPACNPGCDCGRFTELWNLVFIQYDRNADGKLNPLERTGIDTGMGLERIAAVLQEVDSNYDTDLFSPLIEAAAGLCDKSYGDGGEDDFSLRVIADHLRSIAFLIADGVVPANDNRGYVLRRILRRGIRHGRKVGLDEPFLWRLTDRVVELMGAAYPELTRARDAISHVCRREEERFRDTFQIGSRLMEELMAGLIDRGQDMVSGEEMFRLYDTYGMPLDFQEEMAEEKNLQLDRDGFERHLEGQRQRARKAWRGGGGDEVPAAYRELMSEGCSLFNGYQEITREDCLVTAVVRDGSRTRELREGQEGEVLLDATPFYPEGGGQIGDRGVLSSGKGAARVLHTHSPAPGVILHRVHQDSGRTATGDRVTAAVDASDRAATARNHTATHLLNAALRRVLGAHVKQSGSYVGPDRLRFDISHYAPIQSETRQEVETLVEEKILQDVPLEIEEMSINDALDAGAVALFGEKYGDRVRVIRIGDFSLELCGGTHVARTGEIGDFLLLDDSSISAGVRRLEAFSGQGASRRRQEDRSLLDDLEKVLKVKREEIPDGISRLLENQKTQQKEIDSLRRKLIAGAGGGGEEQVDRVGEVQIVSRMVEGASPAELRDLADQLRGRHRPAIVIVGAVNADKGFLNVSMSDDLRNRASARSILKSSTDEGGYRGGGRDNLAEAGGDAAGLEAVMRKAAAAAAAAVVEVPDGSDHEPDRRRKNK